jgi:tetratricopeptide (TPR) repeat protein
MLSPTAAVDAERPAAPIEAAETNASAGEDTAAGDSPSSAGPAAALASAGDDAGDHGPATAPEPEIQTLIQRGEAELAGGEIQAGIETLRRAAEAAPASSLAHTRLGGALLLDRRYGEAITALQRAIALDPASAPAYIGLALAYLHSGRGTPAKAALREAQQLDPSKAAEIEALLERIGQRPAAHPGLR